MKTQRCFAVKPGIDGVLDLSRQTYTEYIDDINGEFYKVVWYF